jgi:glucose-1-phosphate thymidylyltransferase
MLNVVTLGDEYTWFDAGNADSLYQAAGAIRAAQRSGKMIGCLEETALRNGWITVDQLLETAQTMEKTNYGQYLIAIAGDLD